MARFVTAQERTPTMSTTVRKLFKMPRPDAGYGRTDPLVLVNGLAEQSESWFANRVRTGLAIST